MVSFGRWRVWCLHALCVLVVCGCGADMRLPVASPMHECHDHAPLRVIHIHRFRLPIATLDSRVRLDESHSVGEDDLAKDSHYRCISTCRP